VIAACSPDDYLLAGAVPIQRSETGAVVPAVSVITAGLAAPCKVDFVVHVGIRSRGHRMTGITGNPSTARIAAVLHAYGQVVHAWSWRNWCGTLRHWVVAIFTSSVDVPERERVFRLPRCRHSSRRSRLLDLPRTSRLDLQLPKDRSLVIPAQFPSSDVPQIPSPALIRVQNRWLAGNGRSVIDVYAGERGDNPDVGMFVVYRTYEPFGFVTRDRDIYLPAGTRAARITKAPLGKKGAATAMLAKLRFKTKSGATGILNLDGDSVTLDGG